jgi:hypothetical protein
MAALLEVHTSEELERAKRMRSPLLGINNRDLNTFETDLDTTKGLLRSVPVDRVIVSESGLATRQDLAQLAPRSSPRSSSDRPREGCWRPISIRCGWRASIARTARRASACSPTSGISAEAWGIWQGSGGRSQRSRCCAKTSSAIRIKSTRRARPAPTRCC